MHAPLISVVMPAYNTQDFIQEAIESILAQSLIDFEFIIVNDGSTDKTANILERYRNADKRVKVYNNEHRGIPYTLNFGCRCAEGEYIAHMDADDTAPADRFERQISFLRNRTQVAVLGGAVENILSDGTSLGKTSIPLLADTEIRTALRTRNCIAHGTVMMRKSAFLNIGGYREAFHYAEDYDLWLRMSEKYELANLPDVLMRYRLHHNQVTIRNIEQLAMSALAAQASFRMRTTAGMDLIQPQSQITRTLLSQLGVTEEMINGMIISNYGEIISYARRIPLPMKDKEYLDKLSSEVSMFIK